MSRNPKFAYQPSTETGRGLLDRTADSSWPVESSLLPNTSPSRELTTPEDVFKAAAEKAKVIRTEAMAATNVALKSFVDRFLSNQGIVDIIGKNIAINGNIKHTGVCGLYYSFETHNLYVHIGPYINTSSRALLDVNHYHLLGRNVSRIDHLSSVKNDIERCLKEKGFEVPSESNVWYYVGNRNNYTVMAICIIRVVNILYREPKIDTAPTDPPLPAPQPLTSAIRTFLGF
jgi:hypothetical protein